MNFRVFTIISSVYLVFCSQAALQNSTTTAIINPHHNNTIGANCPEGTHDCGFFKCVKEPTTCPLDCKWYDNKSSCDKIQLNGVGCVWRGDACYRNIQCKSLPGNKCSQGCMDCGHFKCLPNGGNCPTGCDGYINQKSCQSAIAINGVGCQWFNTTCGYRQFEVRIAKPDAGENHVGSTPSVTMDIEQSKNNPMVVNPGAGDQQATMNMKSNNLAGPIAGGVVGLVAVGCMAFVLLHKRSEARKQLTLDEIKFSREAPKTLYRPQSLLHVVRSVLGVNSETRHASTC